MSERWWYCLKHMRVEPDSGCPNKSRMGPYDSAEEASRALETAARRNEEWASQDNEPEQHDSG